jgi:hypothetical protein
VGRGDEVVGDGSKSDEFDDGAIMVMGRICRPSGGGPGDHMQTPATLLPLSPVEMLG